ncbi:hypothetical protein OJF2_10000 [Aquisphaera giovannonii]|uniref:DUF1223 domain-containing protein n=1 Tax=Aquisphaera giovannonii TaxID=406548 RepID=A0A5B9VVZ1_9BACT|nr:DUF1223 domain-containing protein [Aquisphaera giovannonii]QEH32523.1 hypothetical protein OJF2_10000 [Aquisphaera giovannonii]
MRIRLLIVAAASLLPLAGLPARGQEAGGPASRRLVLVELFTSQGCDMCPAAEKILGELSARDPRVVPIAFHVDYFNEPWKDVFSDPLYSRRQMAYNELYAGPKDPNYGLYYTPMLMVDGVEPVNGRDPQSAVAAIRRAGARKPAVDVDVSLDVKDPGGKAKAQAAATIRVRSRSPRAERTPLLVCAVIREDGVVTDVPSGENAGKSLVARFPARRTKYEFVELDGKAASTSRFSFDVDPSWDRRHLRLAAFVQDKRTGAVLQAADIPWPASPASAAARGR